MDLTTERTGPKRHRILLDGAPWKEVSTTIFGKRCALPSPCTSLEELELAFAQLEKERAKRYVAFLLAKLDYSTDALRKRLTEHLVSPATTDALLQDLIQKGYLNDERYAQTLIQFYRNRGMGDRLIRTKLLAKGLSPNHLEALPSEDPLAAAKKAWEGLSKRYNLEDQKGKQRAYAAMARRGFEWGSIEAVLTE